MFIFPAKKPPGKRIERNRRVTFFLSQREQFALDLPEQKVVTRLHRKKRISFSVSCRPSARQTICQEIRNADIARLARTHDGRRALDRLVQRRTRVIHVKLVEINVIGVQTPQGSVDRVEQVFA